MKPRFSLLAFVACLLSVACLVPSFAFMLNTIDNLMHHQLMVRPRYDYALTVSHWLAYASVALALLTMLLYKAAKKRGEYAFY